MEKARGPDILITPIPPVPGGVEMAAMVDVWLYMADHILQSLVYTTPYSGMWRGLAAIKFMVYIAVYLVSGLSCLVFFLYLRFLGKITNRR